MERVETEHACLHMLMSIKENNGEAKAAAKEEPNAQNIQTIKSASRNDNKKKKGAGNIRACSQWDEIISSSPNKALPNGNKTESHSEENELEAEYDYIDNDYPENDM